MINKPLLEKLTKKYILDYEESKNCLLSIGRGEVSPSIISFFLSVFITRPIHIQELSGFRDALMELSVGIDLSEYDAIDVCGTGGDGKNTFNISTTSTFVIAGAGVPVAKHGNYGISSNCGSSSLLEYVGVRLSNDINFLKRCMDEVGICFMHAPLFHPAMKHVAPVRKDLQLKTFFNMLGPLVNPAKVKKQVIGTYDLYLARLYFYLFQQSEHKFCIVHNLDGYDEISLTNSTKIYSDSKEFLLHPSQMGFATIQQQDIYGGADVKDSAQIFLSVLKNESTSAQTNVVIANAALAIACSLGIELTEAVERAKESLLSGKALAKFNAILKISG